LLLTPLAAAISSTARWRLPPIDAGRVEEHDAVPRCQERGLVRPVGHPVQVPLDAADKIAAVVQSRTER